MPFDARPFTRAAQFVAATIRFASAKTEYAVSPPPPKKCRSKKSGRTSPSPRFNVRKRFSGSRPATEIVTGVPGSSRRRNGIISAAHAVVSGFGSISLRNSTNAMRGAEDVRLHDRAHGVRVDRNRAIEVGDDAVRLPLRPHLRPARVERVVADDLQLTRHDETAHLRAAGRSRQ